MSTLTHQISPPLFHSSLVFASAFRLPMAIQYSSSLSPAQMHEENDRNPPSDDDLDRDIADSYSDTSDDLVEVSAPDFPRYFQERGGRLFHSHGSSPYPLPVDAEEQDVRRPSYLHSSGAPC